MASHRLLLLHASRASVDQVAEFYVREAADLAPVNLLDEGVMGMLRARDWQPAIRRLRSLIAQGVDEYGVESVLVTCSALGPDALNAIREGSPALTIKIDEPMLETAAGAGGRIGLIATFPSTVETSTAWLKHFQPGAEIDAECDALALQALLQGDREAHDSRLLAAADAVANRGATSLVLAQVSMARLAETIRQRTGLVTLESLTTSLAGLRRSISTSKAPRPSDKL